MRFPLLWSALALVLAGCAASPDVPPWERVADEAAPLDHVAAFGFAPAHVAWLLVDPLTGETLSAHRPNAAMLPASTAKIPAMLFALDRLGADWRLATRVLWDADSRTVHLEGGGDPLLGQADLMGLCRAVQRSLGPAALGAESLRLTYGGLPGFEPTPAINPEQPLGATYNPGLSMLSVDFNVVGAGEARRGLTDPAAHTAWSFRAQCARTGLELDRPLPEGAPTNAVPVARHPSPPLEAMAQAALRHSNNLVAELLVAVAALPWPACVHDVPMDRQAWLASVLASSPLAASRDGLIWNAASGLAAGDRIAPAQMAAVLAWALNHAFPRAAEGVCRPADPTPGPDLLSLLPAAGEDDAFEDRFVAPVQAWRLWAKTGTMAFASGLAGYVIQPEGRVLVLALYTFDPALRAAYDAQGSAGALTEDVQARAWLARAKALEARLVRRWLAGHTP